MGRVSYLGGYHGSGVHAVTGCEVALWDLTGKLLGMPSQDFERRSIYGQSRAYLTGSPHDMFDPVSCRDYANYLKGSVQKWTAAKVDLRSNRPGGAQLNRRMTIEDLDKQVQGFTNVREAVGPYFEIAVHCHWEFDFFDALRLARGMEKIRPWWLEDPMPPNYTDQWPKLTAESPVPILTGENLYTRRDFLPFITNQGVRIIEIDISQAGGLLEAKRIADLAYVYNIPVATHNVMGPVATIASANCAAAMPDFLGHESFDFKNGPRAGDGDVIIYDREIIQDGYIQLSDKPGTGGGNQQRRRNEVPHGGRDMVGIDHPGPPTRTARSYEARLPDRRPCGSDYRTPSSGSGPDHWASRLNRAGWDCRCGRNWSRPWPSFWRGPALPACCPCPVRSAWCYRSRRRVRPCARRPHPRAWAIAR